MLASGVVAIIPVTDLLNPAKASRRPTEQRANPIKRRELKKAAREVEFVFFIVGSFQTRRGKVISADDPLHPLRQNGLADSDVPQSLRVQPTNVKKIS